MELIKSIGIENVVAKRDAAVARLKALFEIVHEVGGEIARLCGSQLRTLVDGRGCRLFERDGLPEAIREIDSGIWAELLLESGLRSFMASTDREKWDTNIMNRDVPELTLDNVTSTFKALYAARGEMVVDGVVAVFRSLSWDHRTNSPMAFGKKIILANLWTDKGSFLNYRRCDVLDDLLRAMSVLDGEPEPDARNGMGGRIRLTDFPAEYWDDALQRRVQPPGSDTLEDGYFTLRWFKKTGTAHIVFKRQDVVDKMNMVLGSRFPDAIATDIRNPVHRPKPAPAPAKRSISPAALTALRAARQVDNRIEGLPQLARLVYEEVDRVLSSLGGAWKGNLKAHVFDGLSATWLESSLHRCLREGAYAEPDDFGFFPTPQAVVQELIAMAELKPGMRVLEPSAGRGAIVKALLDEGCTVKAIELMEANISHLHQFGCSVSQGDFLETRVEPEYAAIVMNPPFTKHQDIAHVMHAVHFLKPGGRLVAVMAAGVKYNSDKYSTQFRTYVSEFGELIDLPAGSFKESGTMVNTVAVVINKPDPARQIKAAASAADTSRGQLALA